MSLQEDVLIMDNAVSYIISFLIEGFSDSKDWAGVASRVGYTADAKEFYKYDLVIVPSGFFDDGVYGKPESLPLLPLNDFKGIPLLYGRPEMEMAGNTLILYADLVASAYFLLTRYEEIIRRGIKDEHGRFIGKESLPYKAGFIQRPIIDEYRILLRKFLTEKEGKPYVFKNRLKAIELTHDIDAPFLYRSIKGFVRSVLNGRGLVKSLRSAFGEPENDPYYTFRLLVEDSKRLCDSWDEVRHFLFFKAGGKASFDKPFYRLGSKNIKNIPKYFNKHLRTAIGLHVSYQAGLQPTLQQITKEKENLEKAWDISVVDSRHHFLSCRNPEDMEYLIKAGIVHDYTMGYADVAGFRLGTSYPVRWINPATRQLTDLCLHPLTVMDCTLDDPKYMGLNYDEAWNYCRQLIRNTAGVGGVLSILWHNSSVAEENKRSYLKQLYSSILSFLENETRTYI